METLPQLIELTRVADKTTVQANLVALTRRLAQTEIDTKWWQNPQLDKSLRSLERDRGYSWSKRIGEVGNNRWFESRAIQTDDGRVQGAICYWINGRSFLNASNAAVYVELLATSPGNREWLVQPPVYRGVGSGLLLSAVEHSYRLGFDGCVNLVSVNDFHSRQFYESRGFVLAGYDGEDDEEKLPRYELSAAAAKEWLRKEGYEI